MISNWNELPLGSPTEIKGIVTAEWQAGNPETQMKAVQEFKDRFKKCIKELPIHGLKNYCCFLNENGKHIFHFSEWTDEASLKNFVHHRDHLFSTSQFEQRLPVAALWKNVYYPYKSHQEKGKQIQNTGLVVFVKQYFKVQGEAKHWIDMILETLTKEGDHEGLIQNTYYLNENETALLNYALWENEESYNKFLQHPFAQTKSNWEQIQSFQGWLAEKGAIRRHNSFVNIYNNEKT